MLKITFYKKKCISGVRLCLFDVSHIIYATVLEACRNVAQICRRMYVLSSKIIAHVTIKTPTWNKNKSSN